MDTAKGKTDSRGGSLVLVLVVTAAGVLLISGVLSWMDTSSRLTERLNEYERSVAAAGAATEKVISFVTRDFQLGGDGTVVNNLPVYRGVVPAGDEDSGLLDTTAGLLGGVLDPLLGGGNSGPGSSNSGSGNINSSKKKRLWTEFEFRNLQGQINQTGIDQIAPWQYTNISTRFPGLMGYCATYEISARARGHNSRYNTVAAVKQEVQVASVPVFGFQVLYGPDLEIHPGTAMSFSGRVHCNGTIYTQPAGQVTFAQPVTASRRIMHQKHPQDPSARPTPTIRYPAGRESGVNSVNLPVGTNSFSALRSILEIPPNFESRSSTMGQQRLYNKADLIILVSNNVAVAYSGAYNNFSVTVPWAKITARTEVVDKNGKVLMSFYAFAAGGTDEDKEDKKNADDEKLDQFDFGSLEEWKEWLKEYWARRNGNSYAYGSDKTLGTNIIPGIVNTNVNFYNARENKTIRCTEIDISQVLAQYSYLTSLLGRPVKTIYVADMRTPAAGTQAGVRIVAGQTLPSGGLTIVSPNPLYVEGHYNVTSANLGSANTVGSVPAALIGDAITVLSPNWADSRSANSLSTRLAADTTVNAALMGGIVPTGGGYYSGGVENFTRLLEDWTGRTLTINGSIVSLFPSQIAVTPWGAANVYAPPTRQWSFETKLSTLSGLPPSTPEVRTVIRRRAEVVPST